MHSHIPARNPWPQLKQVLAALTLIAGQALACQIEEWDASNGTASVWVRIPTIKGNDRQEIKVYWGKPDATTDASAATVFHSANGFASVIHMHDALKDERTQTRSRAM